MGIEIGLWLCYTICMEKGYEEIIGDIKKFTNQFVYDTFSCKKLNMDLLCLYLYGAHPSLMVFHKDYGINHIAEINYRVAGDKCFISTFECVPQFQGNGIGKFLFNMAMAHADALGATKIYGYINPTDEIKGVQSKANSLEPEKEALKQIYTKLGCNLSNEDVFGNHASEVKFEQSWAHGEKLKGLSQQKLEFVKNAAQMQLKGFKK